MKCGIEIGNYQETVFGRKRKSTGFIYLPGSKFREAEGDLTMRSCLQDAVMNYDPRIRKYIKTGILEKGPYYKSERQKNV